MSDTRIYFIKSTRSNAIKIGVSDNPRKRLSNMQTASVPRLVLVAEMPGDERYERQLHAHFAEYRIRGEWFRFEGRLAEFVSLLPAIYATEAKVPRRHRGPVFDTQPDTNLNKYIDRVVYPLLRAAVEEFGVHEFAELVSVKHGRVVRAVWQRGQYFPADWIPWLLLKSPRAKQIAETLIAPSGLRLLTTEEAVAETEAQAQIVIMRANILRILGPEDGARLLAQFDEECAQVIREREADFANQQPLLYAIYERNRPRPETD